MAPINLPDGSQVSEIVLPDGSTASEVLAPDGSTVFSAIPDSGLLKYYRADSYSLSDGQTITTDLTDLEGSDDLPVIGDPTYSEGAVNGNDAIRYDGSDDRHEGDFTSAIPEPFERFMVGTLRSDGTGTNQTMLDGGSADDRWLYYRHSSDDWRMFNSNVLDGPTVVDVTNPHLFAERWDNGSSQLRVDQSIYMSGGTGSQTSLSGLTIGDNTGSINPAQFDFVACAVYDPSASGYSRSDVEQFFVSEFGPF